MAAQDKKISSLTEWVYSNIVDAANIVVAHAGGNYRIAMSAIRQYVLGNRTIGGTGSGDIVTNGDEQMLAYKRLEKPSFNSDTELSWDVTATQMNHLSGLGQNVQNALNSIGGDILTIENRIDGLDSTVNALQADKIYSAQHTAGGTLIVLGSRAIDSNNEIDPKSLSISVYEYTFSTQSGALKLLNLSGIVVSTSGSNLSNVVIANVTAGMTYQIVIRYRLAEQFQVNRK